MNITVGIAEDTRLFLDGVCRLIEDFQSCTVAARASDGETLLQLLSTMETPPDILLLDVKMPGIGGRETAARVARSYPTVRTVALSNLDDELTIIGMLKAGCCAYLLKDISDLELEKALLEVYTKGYYNADAFNINARRLKTQANKDAAPRLNDREQEFLRLSCSDLTYKEIAAKMHLSDRTIDGYRESVFEKLKVQSRVGMALEAIRRKLVTI